MLSSFTFASPGERPNRCHDTRQFVNLGAASIPRNLAVRVESLVHDAPPPALTKPHRVWTGKSALTSARWAIHCGDARTILSGFRAESYSCVVTSPPYFWQRDYGVVGQLGLEDTIEGYVEALCKVMDEVRRVLKTDGTLFLNLGDTYYSGKGQSQGKDRKHSARRMSGVRAVDRSGLGPPKKTLLGMPWRVALAMLDRGWTMRSSIVWKRARPVPEAAKDRPWRTFDFIFMFAKSRSYRFSRRQLVDIGEEDVWSVDSPSQSGRIHPAVFPAEIVTRCLAIGNPGRGRVLDPFLGSGTTVRVAVENKIHADGIELNPRYCHEAAKALAAP